MRTIPNAEKRFVTKDFSLLGIIKTAHDGRFLFYQSLSFDVAAELGFEPRQTVSETVVLTVTLFRNIKQQRLLYHSIPICQYKNMLINKISFCGIFLVDFL